MDISVDDRTCFLSTPQQIHISHEKDTLNKDRPTTLDLSSETKKPKKRSKSGRFTFPPLLRPLRSQSAPSLILLHSTSSTSSECAKTQEKKKRPPKRSDIGVKSQKNPNSASHEQKTSNRIFFVSLVTLLIVLAVCVILWSIRVISQLQKMI
eukprot:TRINITY_DN3650_c0_g1_i3.p1 TRINITY_DN3650_c0_g1~~TRINITY_DN3650_c0_g1_i3.p1  ORF type:complete len:152 (+),score=33.62 TRINITY_DN3650_c0_g1_i3:92-547(+)